MYGKGRVFYATLGHAAETWDDPNVQKLYLEATRWALRLTGEDVFAEESPRDSSSNRGGLAPSVATIQTVSRLVIPARS